MHFGTAGRRDFFFGSQILYLSSMSMLIVVVSQEESIYLNYIVLYQEESIMIVNSNSLIDPFFWGGALSHFCG